MFNFVNLAMNTCALKVLFLHGLDSSRESTKFHAIDAKQKFCIKVDYRNLNYQTVADFYHNIIQKINKNSGKYDYIACLHLPLNRYIC